MKRENTMKNKIFIILSVVVIAIPLSAPAMSALSAQSNNQINLNGTYTHKGDGAKWVFNGTQGQFIQYKSINGNPGTIIIEFTYNLSDQGQVLNYRQTKISLVDHPYAQSQPLDKPSTEKIQINGNSITIGGKIYTKN